MSSTDLPIMAFSTATSSLPRVGHRQLRGNLGPILSEVHRNRGAVEVVNDGQREAVVLDHDVFTELVDASRDASSLRDALPLLLTAVAAGVRVPSGTLDRLGLDLPPINSENLKNFRSQFPIRYTHDEDGTPLKAVGLRGTDRFSDAEDEDDLVFVDGED